MKKRFRKRSYKRRRTFKRKRRFSVGRPKADGAIYTKIHGEFDIGFELANGWGAIFINWSGNGIPANTNWARLTV